MSRKLDRYKFNMAYNKLIVQGKFNEIPEYYIRYRNRYKKILRIFCELAKQEPLEILDIGGGQYALLTKILWNDRTTVADIGGEHLNYLQEKEVKTLKWNLVADEQPFYQSFDTIFFSEVIEHLPIPGHIILERLRIALKPSGLLICSTPNYFRLRNLVYMLLGKETFCYFEMPTTNGIDGHVLEYTKNHLHWQLEKAGFENILIQHRQFHHNPINIMFRIMYLVGYPLFLIPRFRDSLLAIAYSSTKR